MQNEKELKKEYIAPTMNVVNLEHQATLLDCSVPGSCGEPTGYGGEAG